MCARQANPATGTEGVRHTVEWAVIGMVKVKALGMEEMRTQDGMTTSGSGS